VLFFRAITMNTGATVLNTDVFVYSLLILGALIKDVLVLSPGIRTCRKPLVPKLIADA